MFNPNRFVLAETVADLHDLQVTVQVPVHGPNHGGYGGYGNQQDKKTCFKHFGPGRDFTVHDGVGHFDVKSGHCGGDSIDSACNVLLKRLSNQKARASCAVFAKAVDSKAMDSVEQSKK